MVIDDKAFFILSSNRNSLLAVTKLFGLTEEEINNPNAGEWLADCIKQLQTAQLAIKTLQMRQNVNQRVENYKENPFTDKPNPLLENPETQL